MFTFNKKKDLFYPPTKLQAVKQCAILHSTPIARKWTPGHIFTHISRKTRTRTHTHKHTITPTREYNSKGLRRDPFVKLRVRRVDPAISAITIRPKLDDKKIVYAEVKNKRSLKWTENSRPKIGSPSSRGFVLRRSPVGHQLLVAFSGSQCRNVN